MPRRIKKAGAEITSLQDGDALPSTQASSGNDKWFTLANLVTYIKTKIGVATTAISGLHSAADKTKSDSYPSDGVVNQALETDGAGLFVLVPKSNGDMLKSVYDINANNQVDNADQADKIKTLTGNNKVWITDGAGVQIPVAILSLAVAEALTLTGAPGNLFSYGTNAAGVKAFYSNLGLIVGESLKTKGLENAIVREWSGQTTDGAFNELFLLGVASDRFQIADGELWGFELTIIGGKDDETEAFFGKRMGVIKRIGASTALFGAIQTIGTDIGITTDVQITADDANDSLKVEVKGTNPDTWDWRVTGILTKKN